MMRAAVLLACVTCGCGNPSPPPPSSSLTPEQQIGADQFAALGPVLRDAVALLLAQRSASPGVLDPRVQHSGDGTLTVTATLADPAADAVSFDAGVALDGYPSAEWVFTTAQPITLTVDLTSLPSMPLAHGYLDGSVAGRVGATSATVDDDRQVRADLRARIVTDAQGTMLLSDLYVDGQTLSSTYGSYSAGVDFP